MVSDRKQIRKYLVIAKGQLDGIIRMIDEDRYCLDISHQLLASQAVLKKANQEILSAHMRHCVYEAIEEEQPEKVEEMVKMIEALLK